MKRIQSFIEYAEDRFKRATVLHQQVSWRSAIIVDPMAATKEINKIRDNGISFYNRPFQPGDIPKYFKGREESIHQGPTQTPVPDESVISFSFWDDMYENIIWVDGKGRVYFLLMLAHTVLKEGNSEYIVSMGDFIDFLLCMEAEVEFTEHSIKELGL